MTIDENDIVVRFVNLPERIKGLVSPSPDGVYNVFLNARQTHETQVETYYHELKHVVNMDFESDEPIIELEG